MSPSAAPARRGTTPTGRPAGHPKNPGPIPGSTVAERPSLRIVAPPSHRLHVLLAFGLLLVFVILLATASLHTMLVAGQRDLDGVNNQIRSQSRAKQALELRVAELESPARIVDAARADGMIDPETVTWLSPRPDGGADESVAVRPAPSESDAEQDDSADVRAGAETGTETGTETDGVTGGPEGDGSGE